VGDLPDLLNLELTPSRLEVIVADGKPIVKVPAEFDTVVVNSPAPSGFWADLNTAADLGLPNFDPVPPQATLPLAQEIFEASPSYTQTVSIMETDGPTLVGGGGQDLSMEQKILAMSRRLLPVADIPGMHAEPTVLLGAGELGYTPTRGVATVPVCSGVGGCRWMFANQFGVGVQYDLSGRFFEFFRWTATPAAAPLFKR
jgi:hypothetical protein